MKRLFTYCFFTLVFQSAFPQDTLFFKNGDKRIGHVLAIDYTMIHYKTIDNLNGPEYIVEKSKIQKIVYANGKEERFPLLSDKENIHKINEDFRESSPLALFLEFGGNALFFSFNADVALYRDLASKISFTGRAGIGVVPFSSSGFVIPVSASILYGKFIHIEVGAGVAFVSVPGTFLNDDYNQTIPTGILGFRYQKSKGMFFKVAFTPFFAEEGSFQWGGVSLGYGF